METQLGRVALDGEWHGALPRYLALAEPLRGLRVLELGCGLGAGTRVLWHLGGADLTAIDPRAELIQAALASLPELSGRLLAMAYDDLDLPDASFDVVLAIGHDALAAVTALEEVRRVLRPDGVLALVAEVPGVYGLDKLLPRSDAAPRSPAEELPSPEELIGLLGSVFAHVTTLEQRPELGAVLRQSPPPGEPADATVEFDIAAARALRDAPLRTLTALAAPSAPSAYLVLCSDDPDRLQALTPPGGARVVLPYEAVASTLGRRLGDLHRHLDDLSQTHLLLETQLEEKARLADDLEEEVRSQRELARDQAVLLERLKAEPHHAAPSAAPASDDRDATIAHLRAAADRWEDLCGRLQREADLRDRLPAIPAPALPAPALPAQAPLAEQNSALRAELDAALQQLAAIERARVVDEDRALRALAELKERRKQSAALEQRIREQEQEARQFIKEVSSILERANNQDIQINKLQEELEQLKSARSKDTVNAQSLEVEVAIRGQKILKLERDLMGRNLEVNSLERESVQLVKRLADRDQDTEALRQERDALAAQLAAALEAAAQPAAEPTPEPEPTPAEPPPRARRAPRKKKEAAPVEPPPLAEAPLDEPAPTVEPAPPVKPTRKRKKQDDPAP